VRTGSAVLGDALLGAALLGAALLCAALLGANRRQDGSASVLATVVVGVLAFAALLTAVVGGAVADKRRVEVAADLGALAGASAVQRGDDGCGAAAAIVARNRSRLAGCSIEGLVVSVRTSRDTRRVLGLHLTVTSRARAGPADAGSAP
jgi:secretion/DNA translocation related TadE-like protein